MSVMLQLAKFLQLASLASSGIWWCLLDASTVADLTDKTCGQVVVQGK
jgi:hypothetical protein